MFWFHLKIWSNTWRKGKSTYVDVPPSNLKKYPWHFPDILPTYPWLYTYIVACHSLMATVNEDDILDPSNNYKYIFTYINIFKTFGSHYINWLTIHEIGLPVLTLFVTTAPFGFKFRIPRAAEFSCVDGSCCYVEAANQIHMVMKEPLSLDQTH